MCHTRIFYLKTNYAYKSKKIMSLLGLINFTIFALLVSGCTSSSDRKENTKVTSENVAYDKKALSAGQISYNNEYGTFKRQVDSIIVENEKTIAKLKAGVNGKEKEDRERANHWLRVLEQRNQVIKRQISNYVANDYVNWELYKAKYSKDVENIRKALERLTKNGTK